MSSTGSVEDYTDFNWSPSSENGRAASFSFSFSSSSSSYIASSPATSAFSACSSSSGGGGCSPGPSVSSNTSRSFPGGRRRASTSVSATLEAFAKLNTLEEHDAEDHSASPQPALEPELDLELELSTDDNVAPLEEHPPSQTEQSLNNEHQEHDPFSSLLPVVAQRGGLGLQTSIPGAPVTNWSDAIIPPPPTLLPPFDSYTTLTPQIHAESHHEADGSEAAQSPDIGSPANHGEHNTAEEVTSASSVRPPLKPKLSHRLLSKGRARASSLSLIPFVTRPKLERRQATNASNSASTAPGTPSDESPYSSDADVQVRPRAFKRLQGRFTRTAPTTPVLSPSPSTDRVHLFRSRPSSVVVSSRGIEFNYFTPVDRNQATHPSSHSQISSCNVSLYQQALDSPSLLDTSATTQNAFTDALASPEPEQTDSQPLNLFDGLLPREVRVKILGLVVRTAQDELDVQIETGKWTADKSARERWSGERGGLRELVKMSRVSREWQEMAFDGQLWQEISISTTLGTDCFRLSGLLRLANHAGSFLRRLDLRGFSHLRGEDLDEITEACAGSMGVTRLQHINLSGNSFLFVLPAHLSTESNSYSIGCNLVTTRSLHHLLSHSPDLKHLNLRGLHSVVSSTCYMILARDVDNLQSLDVSLCRRLPAAALLELNQPGLKRLTAAKLVSMDNEAIRRFPTCFPQLRHLDIGYSKQIADEAFKSWPSLEEGGTRLEGLRLSGCVRLTDQTCLNLVGKVSQLRYLELANIGGNLRDGGLTKLIDACPQLVKLDVEDAINLTDKLLTSLTPPKHQQIHGPPSPLDHLNITNIPDLSEACIIRLIRACPKLRILECANSSTVSDLVVKAFAHHVKKFGILGSELAIVDCRNVGRQAFRGEQCSHYHLATQCRTVGHFLTPLPPLSPLPPFSSLFTLPSFST